MNATHGPQYWAATVLQERYDRWAEHEPGDGDRPPGRWIGIHDVLADDGRMLRELHPHVMEQYAAPPDTAATYIAGWYAGALADVVGYGLASAGAGVLLESQTVRLHLHDDRWIDRIQLVAPTAVVPEDHPWDGHPAVEVVDPGDVLHRCASSLVQIVAPIIDRCRGLARVGRVGLWNEVGDCLGLAFDDAVPATESVRSLLLAAVAAPGVPWRARPSITIVDDDELGATLVGQKGGCCLAYQCRRNDRAHADDHGLDADELEFREQFGHSAETSRYCATCRFRDPDDARDRQLFWRRLEHRRSGCTDHVATQHEFGDT
jgi:hypothetical protein